MNAPSTTPPVHSVFSCFYILPWDDKASKPSPDSGPSILDLPLPKTVRDKSVPYKPPSTVLPYSSTESSKPLPLYFSEGSGLTEFILLADKRQFWICEPNCIPSHIWDTQWRLYPGPCFWTSIDYMSTMVTHGHVTTKIL